MHEMHTPAVQEIIEVRLDNHIEIARPFSDIWVQEQL